MKYSDINKKYTEIVSEYMAKGYVINTGSMSGSQGEIAKIDFTDGKQIIRVVISKFHDYNLYIDGVEIVVGIAKDNVKPNRYDSWDTIWNNNLEILYCERFYEIGSNRNRETFYGTKEEAEAAKEIKYKRYRYTDYDKKVYYTSEKAMEIAKRVVRNNMGVKRIRENEIKLYKDYRGYVVTYNGKTYRLH